MTRIRTAALVAGVIALLAGAAASAAGVRVYQSRNTYNVAACAGALPRGFAQCHARIVSDRAGRVLAHRFQANRFERHANPMVMRAYGVSPNNVPSGFGPTALNLAYNPAVAGNYPNGVGSSSTIIAIVDAFGYTNANRDLKAYREAFGLPPCLKSSGCFTIYNQRGGTTGLPPEDHGWAQETALDLDMASAMCPQCKIILVEADTNSFANLAAAVDMAALKGAHAISNSYGGGESFSTSSLNQSYHHAGIAITASTGDDGYNNTLDPFHTQPVEANFPASSQHVTAVGGTSLTFDPTHGFVQFAWNEAGSGCSKKYAKPAWQHDSLCAKRMEADVSAVADPETGVAVYAPDDVNNPAHSDWLVFGGTSVAAPLIAGIYSAHGATVTEGSPYGAGVHLTDVTSGSNGSCGGTYFCTAVAGYDGPTGLGTPTGENGF